MIAFEIIIPTYCRPDLLKRTLLSIAGGGLPASLNRLLVVENGPESGAKAVCDEFASILPITYHYESRAGLSNARNAGARLASSPILLFLDDDIRVLAHTLGAYDDAFQRYGERCFFGGPLTPDYEVVPDAALIEFLPWSAKGHSLGDEECEVAKPLFLGGNMAISRAILFEVGGFDEVCATDTAGGVGEETRLQQTLLARGVRGIYVPGALVGHYVPADRCDIAFVLNRRWRTGYGQGQIHALRSLREGEQVRLLFRVPAWYWRRLAGELLEYVGACLPFSSRRSRLKKRVNLHEALGMVRGFRSAITSGDVTSGRE
jgi:GT2 family glycosyltransferase